MCYHLFAHKLSLLSVNQAEISHNFSKKDTTLPFEDKDYVILPHSFVSAEQYQKPCLIKTLHVYIFLQTQGY